MSGIAKCLFDKFSVGQLLQAQSFIDSYPEEIIFRSKNSGIKTLGQLYAKNYLEVCLNPTYSAHNRGTTTLLTAKVLGISCSCGSLNIHQYSQSRNTRYWECCDCSARFKTYKKKSA